VVILDVLGARLDGFEASGLPRLVHSLHERGLEVIVAGRRSSAGAPGEGLETPDLPSAIALAFQLASFS
jgi:hypothetical protein